MSSNQVNRLISLLQSEGVLTIKTASIKLKVSERSIRNYIREANAQTPVIQKDRSKIWVCPSSDQSIKSINQKIPQNYKERSRYMIKKRIIENEIVDLFELSDLLYVSYSTLKNDIAKMNQEYQQFQIHFRLKNDQLYLDGSEKQIRKLISHVLADETASHTINLETLINNYDPKIVQIVTQAVDNMIDHPSILKNDLARMNLILHLVIISQRSQVKEFSPSSIEKKISMDNPRFVSLIHYLQNSFSIRYGEEDLEQIYTLLIGNINYDHSRYLIPQRIIEFSNSLIELLESRYHVELNREMNKEMFLRHIYNLLIRAKSRSFIKNPMKDSIRAASPTIYEMAIVASIEFEHYFHFALIEDEIAFLAIHISNWINQANELSNKLNAIMLCPEYINIQDTIMQSITARYSDDLIITKVVSSEEEIDHFDYDLLISTIPIVNAPAIPSVLVSPIMTETNLVKLRYKIEEIKRRKTSELIRSHFFEYFNESLFFQTGLKTKDSVLSFLCDQLIKHEFVNDSFEKSVREREDVCSTAFSLFAIPHPLLSSATQTKIAVFINPDGIDWNGSVVQVVLLLAINEVDKRIFMNVYEPLIGLLSDDELTMTLARSNSFQSFTNLLLEKM